MEMQQVRYFVTLAQVLNFTRAAEQCNVSQPALTRAIQQLEHELGGPLFHRERSNTHLTELGRMMLPFLTTIHDQSSAAKAQARMAAKLEEATLTIGVMCTIGPQLVADLIVRFRTAYPNVRLDIIDDSAPQMIERLEKGELEIAVLGVPDALPECLHQLPIFEEPYVIVLPPNHRLCAKNALCGADIHDEPYVSRTNCEMDEVAGHELARRNIRVRGVFSSTRDDWVQGMIKAGLGIGLFPQFAVTDPDLVVRTLVEPEFRRTIYLTSVRGRPHSPTVGAFVREARQYPWPVADNSAARLERPFELSAAAEQAAPGCKA